MARALAILGMLAVHVGPTSGEGIGGRLYALPHGRASLLFVLLAGVGITLLTASPSRTATRSRLTLAWRAALLLPLGLALQELDHGAAVILQDYALFFLLATLLFDWDDRWLLGLAGLSATLGPTIFLWGQMQAPSVYDRSDTFLTDPIGETLHGLVLSGPYPLITWAAPLLLGIWVGRRDLRSPAVHRRLAVGGAAIAGLAIGLAMLVTLLTGPPSEDPGWQHLLSITPHSQMILWLVSGTAASVMVLGVALIVVPRARRLFWPLVAAGQLALTVYVGHLLVLHVAPDRLTSEELGPAVGLLVGFTAAILAAATAWRARFARGPLEAALRLPRPILTLTDRRH